MALSWKNITVARTNCCADVLGLAGFLRDDDLICHDGPTGYLTAQLTEEHIENIIGPVKVKQLESGHGSSHLLRRTPFLATDDGIAAGEPTECFNPVAAVRRAEALSRKEGHVGAVAFTAPVTLPPAISAMPG